MIKIATECGMTVKPCAEGNGLAEYGADFGNYMDGDKIHEVPQESWIDMQESLFSVL